MVKESRNDIEIDGGDLIISCHSPPRVHPNPPPSALQMPPDRPHYVSEPLYGPAGGPMSHAIPLQGPLTHPTGPREYPFAHLGQFSPHPPDLSNSPTTGPRRSPKPEPYYPSSIPDPYRRHEPIPPSPTQEASSSQGPGASGTNHYTAAGVPRLPPILQVEKQQVTTSATQMASASRRRNEAHFVCPVPGCGSTFTRRFNLRGPFPHTLCYARVH